MKAWRPRAVVNPASAWGCQFCGSYKNYMGRPGGNYTIICASCGARGPLCDSAYSARATWEGDSDEL